MAGEVGTTVVGAEHLRIGFKFFPIMVDFDVRFNLNARFNRGEHEISTRNATMSGW